MVQVVFQANKDSKDSIRAQMTARNDESKPKEHVKESAEEIDNGLQYHLTRYAFLYESTVLADGMVITPVGDAAVVRQ